MPLSMCDVRDQTTESTTTSLQRNNGFSDARRLLQCTLCHSHAISHGRTFVWMWFGQFKHFKWNVMFNFILSGWRCTAVTYYFYLSKIDCYENSLRKIPFSSCDSFLCLEFIGTISAIVSASLTTWALIFAYGVIREIAIDYATGVKREAQFIWF